MISIDDHHPPQDPSSSSQSHHHHQLKTQNSHELKVSDIDLKYPDADLDDNKNPTPNFSIRDYVFSLRSKDVACNWPFSHTSLQLCLKHGVKNLLPPFQSNLDLLRNNHPCVESRLPDEEFVSSFDVKPTDNQEHFQERALRFVNSNSSGFQENLVQTRLKEKPPASSQKTENLKKSKLIMKLNSGVEIGEVAPNSFIFSETMASKVCPVCKIFTSSSNTTLNAHIDQCLTGEGTMKWTDNPKVIVKHKIKPRKTRLMVDIYETAPRCTVEELDRRNGTSWANTSSFPAQEFEYQEEKDEPKMNTHEGDVYIDTNGTKVRILSVPKTGSSDDHRDRKLLKGIKGSKIVMGKKKSNILKQKHHQKYLNLSHNARNLCSQKPQAKVADLAIVRPPWACSKRTDLSKKLISDKQQKLELGSCATKDDKPSSPCNLGATKDDKPRSLFNNVGSSNIQKKLRTSSKGADSPDSSPSQHSDLRRNFSFSETKITLKRKFASVKKFRVVVDESSQDESLEEQSRKEETIRSITSKSTNEESVDALPDIESIRNDTLSNTQKDCVVPESFVCLSNSFDPECVGMYQDPTNPSPDGSDDIEKHESFDPIPIPGPPGSFLPSPGGETVSEEQVQANSSLTENQHHHDVIDQDSMSTSPVSDVSNPSLARSDSRSSEKLAYKATSADAIYKKSLPNESDTSFKNDQPCCCSRKEASGGFRNFGQGVLTKESSFVYTMSSNYQDSTILRKQVVESNGSSSGLNFNPEMFSLSNYPISPPPEKPVIVPTTVKPVLRLMGKNLTVVKTDEDASSSSQQFRPLPQRSVIFSQNQNGFASQNFNVYPQINKTRNLVDLRPSYNGGFVPIVDRYGHSGPYSGPIMPESRFHYGHAGPSGSKPVKEIVVIDDSSENEGDDDYMRKDFVGRSWGQINPLTYRHPYGGGGGSSMFRGGGFQTSLANGDVGTWKLGSSSPSRSTSHLRSSTQYNPPSYP